TCFRFFCPFFTVVITFKADVLTIFDVSPQHLQDSDLLFLPASYLRVHFFLELDQSFCHDGIQSAHRGSAVSRGPYRTELEFIAGECEWTGPVPVRIVHQQFRDMLVNIHFKDDLVLLAEVATHTLLDLT